MNDRETLQRQVRQFAPGVAAIACLAGVWTYISLCDVAPKVEAPLFALVAATGLAARLGSSVDDKWAQQWNFVVGFLIVGATTTSAYKWLVSAEAGFAVELVGGVWVVLVVIAILLRMPRT